MERFVYSTYPLWIYTMLCTRICTYVHSNEESYGSQIVSLLIPSATSLLNTYHNIRRIAVQTSYSGFVGT